MKKVHLTKREKDVLEVLWSKSEPLLVSDFPKINPSLSISSVQVSVRNLVKKKMIEVADIVHSGTVLSRRYRPLVSQEDYHESVVIDSLEKIEENISATNVMAALLEKDKNEKETILELEKMLKERKKKFQ